MTARLHIVPPLPEPDLRETAIRWADETAGLARTLARSLRRSPFGEGLRPVAVEQARASLALTKAVLQLLEADEAAGK
jgi:hypothetical protein